MAVDLRVLKKHKCDTESLKALFDLSSIKGKEPEASVKIRAFLRDITKSGIERSLVDYRTWAAVDLAYDAPFYQETPTIIRSILSGKMDAAAIQGQVKAWGLCEDDFFCKAKVGGKDALVLNAPAIFTTLVPVVRSYVAVRTAKIFNDRNLVPLLKYEPLRNTAKNRAKCEMLTNLVQAMTTTMGYSTVLQRMILNPMLYSVALSFPMEPWFSEEQEVYSEDEPKDGEDAKTEKVRQGLRYALPHITRTFYDLQHPLASFNTDTGGSYAGYWTIARYKDVADNKIYWNKDKITYGFNWLAPDSAYRNYFEQAYPCTLQLPIAAPGVASKTTDREQAAALYTSTDNDKAIFVTPTFIKIIPKDWGIGTYTHPVWFRFFVGADDTILHAEPYPYRPITATQYDPDQNRAKNASLALEIIPSQDMLGNLLTQIVLTIKRNLANVTFYDTNLNVGTQMEDFQKRNQWQYQGLQFIGYDSLRQKMGNLPSPKDSFHSINFPYADTGGMFAAINTVISILERLLVISPQEIGAAASHQQSVQEINTITANTSNRVAYTASFIDEAIDAWKAQLYEALVAYGSDEFVAEMSTEIPDYEKVMKELGLDKVDDVPGERKIIVKGKKSALKLESFASTKDGPDRTNDQQGAQAMNNAIASINQNPLAAQVADPESILEALTETAKMMGAPDDFKIRTKKEAVVASQVADIAQQITQGAVQQAVQQVTETVAKPAAAAVAQHSQEIQQLSEHLNQLAQNVEKIQAAVVQSPPLLPPTQLDPANDPNLQPAPVG